AVEPGFALDALRLSLVGQMRLADLDLKVLGHLATADDGADSEADLGLATQRIALAAHPRRNPGQILLGPRQQFGALARPLRRQQRIAADDQPLAREVFGRA